LLRLARDRGEDFQHLLTRHANERLLYRLGESSHVSFFVLKGAALFTLWTGQPHRATRDLDLLGSGEPNEDHIRSVLAEVITLDVEDDGVVFDADSLSVGPIREEQAYGGLRAVLSASVSNARLRLQIDVGFGDAITPEPMVVDFPTLLEFPAPRLRVYPRETVVAEKLESIVQLGLANSRMKDFFDLVILSRTFSFDGKVLVRAIRATFDRRGTDVPRTLPVALTQEFTEDRVKNSQWNAFVRKSDAPGIGDLQAVVESVIRFVQEPLRAVGSSSTFEKKWPLNGPWE
jgi:predicted nucleotidyltransferase component of viral defense system